jgi:hypothetical protein
MAIGGAGLVTSSSAKAFFAMALIMMPKELIKYPSSHAVAVLTAAPRTFEKAVT